MLLPGVADCCRLIDRFAFTDSWVLLISITFCFDFGFWVFQTAKNRQAFGRFS